MKLPQGPRQVLVISYFYPPFQSVGALRVSKVTRHLGQYGWEPHVVTVAKADLPATMPLEIPSSQVVRTAFLDVNILPKLLLGRKRVTAQGFRVGLDSPLHRLVALLGTEYRRWVNFPDGQTGWYPFAVRAALDVARKVKPAVVYSSALPGTAHMVAANVARRTGIPWVAEYRDPWTDNPNYDRPRPLRRSERALEDAALAGAAALVAVTPQVAKRMRARFGKPVAAIPNGVDVEDYPRHVEPSATFTMTFTGMVYPGNQTAEALFGALARLRREGKVPPGFKARFIGRNVDVIGREAATAGVSDLVELLPQMERHRALEEQCRSTVLILLLWTGGDDAWYPAKMFEYFGAGRPILALGPASNEAAQLIQSIGAGRVGTTVDATADILRAWFADYAAGGLAALPGIPVPERFERASLVGDLAELFDQVSGSRISPAPG